MSKSVIEFENDIFSISESFDEITLSNHITTVANAFVRANVIKTFQLIPLF